MSSADGRPAVLYVRPIDNDEGENPVVLCQARADQRGWTAVGVYEDDRDGTGLQRLREDMDGGIADAIIVFSHWPPHAVPGDLLADLADEYGTVTVVYPPRSARHPVASAAR